MTIALLSAASSVHTIRWANAFVQRGQRVHLITLHAPGAGLDPGVSVHRLPFLGGLGYLLNGPRLAKLLRSLAPDVVNAHYATGYGTLARWCVGIPVVLNVWGSDVYAFPGKSILHHRLVLRNLLAANHLVSTSEDMASRTRSLASMPLPITVVPFGVDTDLFRPKNPGDDDGPITIGTVKTLEPVYGVDLLVEAYIRLCGMEDLPQIRLRVTGAGTELHRLEQALRTAGLAHRAFFAGAVPYEQVPAELAELDIYVALSRAESFGVAVIEASACGLPVVVSNVGGLHEVVDDGVTGLVVPADDVEAAVVALGKLLRSPDLRHRMGKAGRSLVKERFAWDRCVDRMLEVLEQVQRSGA